MWVAELRCDADHGFEGYFGSKDDFESQKARGLVSCPLCGSAQVERRLSAPRINLGVAAPQTSLRELIASVRARTEDVGERFATEARRMHEGETPPRPIRGQARGEELVALLEDGVPVLPLPDLDPAH